MENKYLKKTSLFASPSSDEVVSIGWSSLFFSFKTSDGSRGGVGSTDTSSVWVVSRKEDFKTHLWKSMKISYAQQ